ncbi:unnamed protein product [Moneuplotes crassus]|uniref:Uncharacterized protein n=1 Tax=Euplotes crassus TaxID=5936 RepID=A0AAD2D9V5_EUPCR|nr:unnamed protein product [Moneuplotes crassus]
MSYETASSGEDEDLSDNYSDEKQGLIDKTNECGVPLFYVDTKVSIHNNIAEIEFLQYYFNDKNGPIQAEHVFPVHANCTFTSMKAYIGDEVLQAEVMETEEAKKIYVNSEEGGSIGVIAYPFPRTRDIMVVQMGNLPPNTLVILSCVFHQVMEIEDLSWRLHIPSTIHPRYFGDLNSYIHSGANLKGMVQNMYPEDSLERQQQHVDRIASLYSTSEFLWGIEVIINSPSPVTRVISSSHEINTTFSDENNQVARINLDSSDANSFFERDFKLLYRNREVNRPIAVAQCKGNIYALMVSMLADCTPEMEWDSEAKYQEVDMDPDIMYKQKIETQIDPPQYTFIIDCSGSMYGSKMALAKEALALYINSLPPRCEFNILRFGDDHEFLFEDYQIYSNESLQEAIELIDEIEDDMGGTELFSCFKSLFENGDANRSVQNRVILLTDGSVYNPDPIYELIRENSENYSLDAFGIGSGASTDLIINCAKAGNGKHYMIDDSCDGLKKDIINCLSSSFSEKITVMRKDFAAGGKKLYEYPKFVDIECSMAHGSYFTYYCIIDTRGKGFKGSISFDVQEKKNGEEDDHLIDLKNDVKIIDGDFIFKMFCDSYIKDSNKLELGKDKIIEMSLKYQTASDYTCLVIIGSDNKPKQVVPETARPEEVKTNVGNINVPENQKPIIVFVKTGEEQKELAIYCSEEACINDLKNKVCDMQGKPRGSLHLIYKGGKVDYGKSLSEYMIRNASIIYAVPARKANEVPIIFHKSKSEISFEELVKFQNFDGSWGYILEFLATLDENTLKSKLQTQIRETLEDSKIESIWYTWLALSILKAHFSHYGQELELITKKGKDYIYNTTKGKATFEDLKCMICWY